MKLMDSGWSRKFDINQFQILDFSIFWSLQQFQKFPWILYDSVCYMQMEPSPQFVIISAEHYDNGFPR